MMINKEKKKGDKQTNQNKATEKKWEGAVYILVRKEDSVLSALSLSPEIPAAPCKKCMA